MDGLRILVAASVHGCVSTVVADEGEDGTIMDAVVQECTTAAFNSSRILRHVAVSEPAVSINDFAEEECRRTAMLNSSSIFQ